MNNTCPFNLKSFLESETMHTAYTEGSRTALLIKVPAPEHPLELTLLYMVDLWEYAHLPGNVGLAGIY